MGFTADIDFILQKYIAKLDFFFKIVLSKVLSAHVFNLSRPISKQDMPLNIWQK